VLKWRAIQKNLRTYVIKIALQTAVACLTDFEAFWQEVSSIRGLRASLVQRLHQLSRAGLAKAVFAISASAITDANSVSNGAIA